MVFQPFDANGLPNGAVNAPESVVKSEPAASCGPAAFAISHPGDAFVLQPMATALVAAGVGIASLDPIVEGEVCTSIAVAVTFVMFAVITTSPAVCSNAGNSAAASSCPVALHLSPSIVSSAVILVNGRPEILPQFALLKGIIAWVIDATPSVKGRP